MKKKIWMVLGPEGNHQYMGGRPAWWGNTRKVARLKKAVLKLTYPNIVFSGPYKSELTPACKHKELNA